MSTTENATRPDETTRSPLRTMQILYELTCDRSAISLADLSVRLSLPKTSLFRLMKTLESGAYVIAVAGGYKMGPAALKLGAAIIQSREFPNCAVPVMQHVSENCGETIILGTLADNRQEVVYAEVVDATNPLRFSSKAGSTNPLYGSASGQILLAYMPESELNSYLDSVKLVKHAPGTIETVEALVAKLAEIRATGVSSSLEGLVEGVFSIAAPVMDMNGKVVSGLSISAPSSRALRQKGKLTKLALLGGEEISRILGYTGTYPLTNNNPRTP
ncbi:IclR family transcriptional regulator [Candidimonas sp. SYP-B2681]|uniref:IclR family transcriptional regulator n=1 Tax=Candidimonas sp. SYP-B2681 TaxID=2497686 RepID=UPI00131523DB|nr:IclR family transcriptional regulator [Candidimonas sp. SYP-B2681]